MKYFTLIFFFFLTITVNAQLTMEEIAYVPSPSGYYNHLIVKGDVNIKKLQTYPLNIQSYGSFLDITVNNSGTAISSITVSTNTFVSLKNAEFPYAPLPNAIATMTIYGGKVSLQQKDLSTPTYRLKIENMPSIQNLQSNSTITYKTQVFKYPQDVTYTNQKTPVGVKNTYIMGMKIPHCDYPGQWVQYTQQDTPFYILYCGPQS